MNFTVIREHREFFRKHHWIECEGVLSQDDVKRLSEGISLVLADSKEVKAVDFVSAFDKNSFEIGHDNWRGRPLLKKIILSRGLAGIAGELIEQKPLRFGYDTLFPLVGQTPRKNVYENFLKTTPTLEEMSCIQGVLCGAMLCLSASEIEANIGLTTSLFSKIPGNAVFFSVDWPLPLHEIYQNPGFTYLLIVYVKANAVYFSQQGDPHLHYFKSLGYNFGDRLREPLHPIVYS
jgi:hypothetical protein